MENRFEESFNELGLIYENYFVKKAGGQKDLNDNGPGFRKDAMNGMPGGSLNQYNANQGLNGMTTPVSDEEAPEEAPEEDPIIVKLEELQKEAEDNGQDYAVLQLAELKKFIEKS